MKGLSVIIPVKDPEPYLTQLMANVYRTLKDIPNEIICRYDVGLTNAVIKGVERSRYSHIAVMDADGSHLPFYLLEMYNVFHLNPDVDLVVGSKNIPGGRDHTSSNRHFISKVYRYLARSLLDLDVSDPMSGYVMGKRELFLQLSPSDDYKFLLQLLCLRPSWVVEIPIVFFERISGKSKANLRTGLNTLKSILKLWRKTRR